MIWVKPRNHQSGRTDHICEVTAWLPLIWSVLKHMQVTQHHDNTFSRGSWTWPPWVICIPDFNHKIGSATHFVLSEVLFLTNFSQEEEMDNLEATPRCNEILETSNCVPIQGGWLTNPTTTEIITVAWRYSVCSLSFPCRNSYAESFSIILVDKARIAIDFDCFLVGHVTWVHLWQ